MSTRVTSLEISKQLKETGWKKETEFYWLPCFNGVKEEWHLVPKKELCGCGGCKEALPAPLATELLEELPSELEDTCVLLIRKLEKEYEVGYGVDSITKEFEDKSLPNALAKMRLYLKKEGLIK
jgi:hypothetical protein